MAGAGVPSLLLLKQLAIRAIAGGVDRIQLFRRLFPDHEENFRHRGLRFAVLTVGVAGDWLLLGDLQIRGLLRRQPHCAVQRPASSSTSSCRSASPSTPSRRSPSWSTPTAGNVARYALPHYALFVTYFPHLIAGPILHHREMMPQFERRRQAARSASDPVRPDHLRDRPVQEDVLADGIQPLVALAFGPNTPTFVRPGSARWPTRSSSISISPATPTWRSAWR